MPQRIIKKHAHNLPVDLVKYLFFLAPYVRCLKRIRLRFWILEGEEKGSGKPLSILCGANDKPTRNYIAGLAFREGYRERSIGKTWSWDMNRIIDRSGHNCDLVFVNTCKGNRMFIKNGSWIFIPYWVEGVVDLPLGPEILKSSTVRSDIRRIRNNGLVYEVTRDEKLFDDFYWNMHIPHVTTAHEKTFLLHAFEIKRRLFKRCELLLVKKEDRHIAGMEIGYYRKCPDLIVLGILDGDKLYVREGAMGATYLYSLQYLGEKGCDKCGMGLSKAFLRDGVLLYKRKWGQRLVNTHPEQFGLKVLKDNEGARAFLANNPFIFEHEGGLDGAVFVDTEQQLSPESLDRIFQDYFHPGLSKLVVYTPGTVCEQTDVVPAELSDRIVLRKAEEVLCCNKPASRS
jgi:hypothetical protein